MVKQTLHSNNNVNNLVIYCINKSNKVGKVGGSSSVVFNGRMYVVTDDRVGGPKCHTERCNKGNQGVGRGFKIPGGLTIGAMRGLRKHFRNMKKILKKNSRSWTY